MSFPNIYMHRKVAETSSKACSICYKPSTSVLVTAENKDFFYVCPGHLKDSGFCTPVVDEAAVASAAAAKKKKELEDEVKRVKEEFEAKQKLKTEKEKEKEKDKEGKKEEPEAQKKDEEKSEPPTPTPEEEPRIFALKASFYKARLDKKRNAEVAKRNMERFQNPSLFPAVPKGLPGGGPGASTAPGPTPP